jgi:predicted nucleic acid-binding protein
MLEMKMPENVQRRPIAFLDTSVLLAILKGDTAAARLASRDVLQKVQLAVNPIVLLELARFADVSGKSAVLSKLERDWEVLPVTSLPSKVLQEKARGLRNMLVHSNDLLILSSAATCDYLITYDKALAQLAADVGRPQTVTPEEFFEHLAD